MWIGQCRRRSGSRRRRRKWHRRSERAGRPWWGRRQRTGRRWRSRRSSGRRRRASSRLLQHRQRLRVPSRSVLRRHVRCDDRSPSEPRASASVQHRVRTPAGFLRLHEPPLLSSTNVRAGRRRLQLPRRRDRWTDVPGCGSGRGRSVHTNPVLRVRRRCSPRMCHSCELRVCGRWDDIPVGDHAAARDLRSTPCAVSHYLRVTR